LKISIYTGGWRLTKQEPLNNSVRIAIQALAAALGGVQHLGTLSIDEALSTPSQEAVQLAVRTQQILAYEARAGHVVDPLGGSYLVESLTDQLEQAIWDLIAGVEREGGTVAAIRNGYFQQVITETSYRYALAIEDGTEVAVGVNRFVSGDQSATSVKTFTINDEVEQRQLTRLKEIKESRSNDAVRRTLAGLHDAAEAGENVMDPLLSSVKSNATCGEIFDVLRDVHGSYSDERIAL
jgi:methylmalonyl-CoA mutase N-terminal domain/subunit